MILIAVLVQVVLCRFCKCEYVVSDESSVMAEALMFGKPSVAVTDWMIPDEDPPRPASVPMDYVIKCEKKDLREKVLSCCLCHSCSHFNFNLFLFL